MRDLGRALVEGHEARVGELVEHRVDVALRGPFGHEVVHVDTPPGLFGAVTDLGEPEEHAAEERAARFGRVGEHAIGGPRDRRLHPAGFVIPVERERAPVT